MDKKLVGENNADLAIKELRNLQEMFFKHDVSDNDLFNYTNRIIKLMEAASKDINTNFEFLSKKLTSFMNGQG
jgi:hypothetical protein